MLNVFLLFYLQIQGAICVASLFKIVLGFSGIVGFLLQFIGPLTVAPTVALVGLALFGAAGDFFWYYFFFVITIADYHQYRSM